jgi:thioredoxin-related protein
MKKKVILLILSLLYIPIWGLLLLDATTATDWSRFIALIYAVISGYYIHQADFFKEIKRKSLYVYLFPCFYLGAFYVLTPLTYYNLLLNPILWAFLGLTMGRYLNALNPKSLFFIGLAGYFYAYHVHPTYEELGTETLFDVNAIEEKDLKWNHPLSNYQFENHKKDTFQLSTRKPFILLETWNEQCPPCIAAMKSLQPLLDTLSSVVDHYYLYENGGAKMYSTKHTLYNYERIHDKTKILMDVDNKLFVETQMKSFPYFLLFDNKGNLIDYFKGYDERHQDYFINRIKKMVHPTHLDSE